MSRKTLIALTTVFTLMVSISGAYVALAWQDTNPLEMQLGRMALLPGDRGALSLTVRNRSYFPVQFEGATLWHPTDQSRKPMHSFNMESIPFVRHSLRPGQSLTFTSTTFSPGQLMTVDSFECTYVWIPLGRTEVRRVYDWLLNLTDWDFERFRDKSDGEETIENPNYVAATRGTKPESEH